MMGPGISDLVDAMAAQMDKEFTRPYNTDPKMSARNCGCDPGANYVSEQCQEGCLSENDGTYQYKTTFITKDSGERRQFESGMQRDTTTGKVLYHLVRFGPMFMRWVLLLTRGAIKYDANNWMKANGQAELDRFLESADRHFSIWLTYRLTGVNMEDAEKPTRAPLTEDHAAAVFFNINGAEYVWDQMTAKGVPEKTTAGAIPKDLLDSLKRAKAEEDERNAKHRQDVERQRVEEEQRIDREIAEVKKRLADRANQLKRPSSYQEGLMKDGAKPLPLLPQFVGEDVPAHLDTHGAAIPGPSIKKEMQRIVQFASGADLKAAGFLGSAFEGDSSWKITVERERW